MFSGVEHRIRSGAPDLHVRVLSLKYHCIRYCSNSHTNNKQAKCDKNFRIATPAVSSSGGSGSAGGCSGGGSGGGGGGGSGLTGGDNNRFGPQGSDPSRNPHSWLRLLASAAAAYVLLGLLQPQRLLWPGEQIDTSAHTVAVIIPVLNEAGGILATLQALHQLQPPPDQIIVVDGGSTDGTVKLVRKCGLATKVLQSGRGRAVQMNAGAEAASADVLCFLHADTTPPGDLVSVIRRELVDPQTVLAGFVPSIEIPGKRLWLMSFHDFISTYYAPLLFRPLSYLRGLRALFGDQTMFCRACDFKAVGGFDPKLCIMEDLDLCVRMHMAGPVQQQQQQQQCEPQPCRKAASYTTLHSSSSSSCSGSCGHDRDQRHDGASPAQYLPVAAASPASSTGSTARLLGILATAAAACQSFQQPRGRVKQVLDRVSVTSGRRLAAWGNLKATYIHAVISCSWYFQNDPAKLKALYTKLYTDCFR